MNFSIETDYNKIDKAKWAEFVENHPDGNFFQTPEFVEVYEGVGKYNPFALSVYENNSLLGIVVGVIQKENYSILSFMTSRAIIIGGPLILNDKFDVFVELLAKLNTFLKSKAIYTEFRNLSDLKDYKRIILSNGFSYEEHLNIIIDCLDLEKTFSRVKSERRRQIRKAKRSGIKVITEPSEKQIKLFYFYLTDLYKKISKPIPPYNFFKNSAHNKSIFFFLVTYNGNIIGGNVCPVFNGRSIYEWYKFSLDREFKKQYPGVIATWSAIEYACKNDIKVFDFLGAGKPDEDYGVREFKSQFGGNLVDYGRFKKINSPLLFNISKFAFRIWQKIK